MARKICCTSLTSFHELLLSAKKLTFFSFVTGILEKLYKKCFSLFTPLAMHSARWWAPRENTDYYLPRKLQIKVYIIYIQFFHNDFSCFIILHLFPCFKVLLVNTTCGALKHFYGVPVLPVLVLGNLSLV